MSNYRFEWFVKRSKKERELLDQLIAEPTDRTELAIIHLKLLDLSIYPHSLNGRSGFKKSLKLAIKALERARK